MSIFVTGDTHGSSQLENFSIDGFMHRLNTANFPEQKTMGKDDFVIICGDFGGVWNYLGESKEEKNALDWLASKPFTTLFVPGNHENYDRLTGIDDPDVLDCWMFDSLTKKELQDIKYGYPQKLWHGGMVRQVRSSVLMLERGYVFNIDGCKCFAFGGARSHDISDGILHAEQFETKKLAGKEYKRWELEGKEFRVNHLSWWKQEMPDIAEMEMGFAMLEDEGNKVDFIFSHDCPASDAVALLGGGKNMDALNRYLEQVKQTVDYKKWFFGHYHDNKVLPGGKDILLYEQILQIH